MRTDQPIYLFLSAGPEAFRVLTGGLALTRAYRFSATTIMSLERRIDGLLEPDGHAGPVHLVEFYGQPAPTGWYNLLTKLGLYGEQYPDREVRAVGVFLRRADMPSQPAWVFDAGSPVRVVALVEVLRDLLARDPDDPYVATLAPLAISNADELKARAPQLWQTVQQAPLPEKRRDLLAQVLEFWFFECFRGLSAQEIWTMLNIITPIQETKAYQSIFAEGKTAGKTEGKAEGKAEGEAVALTRLLTRRFGPLPDWAETRIAAAGLPQLDAWLDGLFDTASLTDLLGPPGDDAG